MPDVYSAEASVHCIGRAVRRERSARAESLRQLAGRLGVSPATLSAIETGKTDLSVTRLHQIANALDIPVTDLLQDARPAPPRHRRGARSTVTIDIEDWRKFAPLPIDNVLASAIRSILATGYHGTSMRAIAARADMSVAGVYHHYRGKQELLAKILDITMTDLIWRVKKASGEAENPIARVRLVVESLALFHARRTGVAFIAANEMRSLERSSYRRVVALRDDVQNVLDQAIDEALAQGAIRVTNARDASRAIATMCTSLAEWYHPDGPTTPEQIAIEYTQFALRVLQHRGD